MSISTAHTNITLDLSQHDCKAANALSSTSFPVFWVLTCFWNTWKSPKPCPISLITKSQWRQLAIAPLDMELASVFNHLFNTDYDLDYRKPMNDRHGGFEGWHGVCHLKPDAEAENHGRSHPDSYSSSWGVRTEGSTACCCLSAAYSINYSSISPTRESRLRC